MHTARTPRKMPSASSSSPIVLSKDKKAILKQCEAYLAKHKETDRLHRLKSGYIKELIQTIHNNPTYPLCDMPALVNKTSLIFGPAIMDEVKQGYRSEVRSIIQKCQENKTDGLIPGSC
ncbi:MAG: hypothetical protein K0R66_783 [Gammaproteobacteria bacterium]|nr:hypothetical protein [Gammaproteobacteria bacterium]